MTTFVDTSAFIALLDSSDERHAAAGSWLETVAAEENEDLLTHSYVVNETIALTHRRLGTDAARTFVNDLLPVCDVRYIDAELHARATSAFLAANRKRPSFVDRVSFELMRDEALHRAFVFDRDFVNEGFTAVP